MYDILATNSILQGYLYDNFYKIPKLFINAHIFLAFISIMVVFTKNPIHSLIWLILAFLMATILMVSLKAEFLALLFLIVYLGAIAVLFLFVIMMLSIRIKTKHSLYRYGPIIFILTIILTAAVFQILNYDINQFPEHLVAIKQINSFELYTEPSLIDIQQIGNSLYSDFGLFFIISGWILLLSMIISIAIVMNKNYIYSNKKDLSDQINQNKKNTIYKKRKIFK